MGPTGDTFRVIQVHPARQCNLRCLHCYSTSGPEERVALRLPLLQGALDDARANGFTVVGVSGGEPLLYADLRALLEHAHSNGMLTTVTSNGMLLNQRRLDQLQGAADLLAISLDGVAESHNRMRASPRAFETMVSRLEGVRRSGIPFGFIFTLTLHNVHELEWVANFAVEQGAKLLQVHPLEEVGRARELLAGARPDETEAAYAFLEVRRLRQLAGDRLFIQLDLVDRDLLASQPARVFALDEDALAWSASCLADLVSPLIVETDGTVVPIQYGFERAFAFGNLHEERLAALAARWTTERYPAFRRLCRRVFEQVTQASELPFFNWYEAIGREARLITVV